MSGFIDKSEYGTLLANEDLSSVVYRFVKTDVTGLKGELCDAITDKAYGVQQEKVDSGIPFRVKRYGESYVVAGETLAVGDIVAPAADGRAQKVVSTQFARGRVTKPATSAGDIAVIELFNSAEAFLGSETELTITGGDDSGAVALRFGTDATEGLELRVHEESVVIGGAAAAFDLNADIPAGAVIVGTQLNLETLITATTATKVGIGVAADPDKYGITGDLLKNTKSDLMSDWAVLAGAEDVQVYSVDNAGAAAGTLDSGTVRVRIYYYALNSLKDAA